MNRILLFLINSQYHLMHKADDNIIGSIIMMRLKKNKNQYVDQLINMKDMLCNSTTIYNVIISFTNEKVIIITLNMIFKL